MDTFINAVFFNQREGMLKIIMAIFLFLFYYETIALGYKPILSLNSNVTKVFPELMIDDGIFDYKSRRMNVGFQFLNRFSINQNYFLQTGIRFNQYKTIVSGLNQIPTLHNKPDPFTWESGFQSLTIPLLFGKSFSLKNGKKGDYFLGANCGIIFNSYVKNAINSAFPKNDSSFSDYYRVESKDVNIQNNIHLYSSVDAGINYQIFTRYDRLYFGVALSYQVNKFNSGEFSGNIEDVSKNKVYNYSASLKQQFFNVVFSFNYYFNKSQRNK